VCGGRGCASVGAAGAASPFLTQCGVTSRPPVTPPHSCPHPTRHPNLAGIHPKTLLDWLAEEHAGAGGPLGALHGLWERRARVRVRLRAPPHAHAPTAGAAAPPTAVTGYLRAIDGDWNMVLLDAVAEEEDEDGGADGHAADGDGGRGGEARAAGSKRQRNDGGADVPARRPVERFRQLLVLGGTVVSVGEALGAPPGGGLADAHLAAWLRR
jgi:hypothetical protein